MYEKMTVEEFMKVLGKFYNFEIWGWEGILNMIASLEYKNSKEFKNEGFDLLSDDSVRRANGIHDILKERGYY